jgi:triphosphoribosyl-dephospho-CoA synthase
MSPDRIAQSAQLAMLIELSSDPKPGNVDRCHDFSDIGYHDFVISAVSIYPIFRTAAQGGSIGRLLLEAEMGHHNEHPLRLFGPDAASGCGRRQE